MSLPCHFCGRCIQKFTCEKLKTQRRIKDLESFLTANSSNNSIMQDASEATNAPHGATLAPASLQLSAQIDAVIERTERLLLRHEELFRTNTLLQSQLHAVIQERDMLLSRLAAARSRIDALIERLPEQSASDAAVL
jgi:cell division protein ZapB